MAEPIHLAQCGLPGNDRVTSAMHTCHLYADRDQLVATIVPYLVAGLRANERCLCGAAPPLTAGEAVQALRAACADVDDAIRADALRGIDFDQWYSGSSRQRGNDVGESWPEEEECALAEPYSDLRIAGNTRFLESCDWQTIMEYGQAVTARFVGRRIVVLCSYGPQHCNDHRMSGLPHAHHCAFVEATGG